MKFEPKLKKGRNDVTVIFTDAEGNATRKTFNFVANPDVDIVVDAAYTGEAVQSQTDCRYTRLFRQQSMQCRKIMQKPK